MDEATRADRIAGAMLGAAIGDALGSAFEFLSSERIERIVGEPFVRTYRAAERGSLLYPREPGRATDDTALALSVAWTLARHPMPTADEFARGFLEDTRRESGRVATMFWNGGPGGATTRAFHRLARGAEAATCGAPDDGGNGAAMRAHPVGALRDRDEVLRIAALQARTTHGHPAAVAAAQAVAVLVCDGIHGEPLSPEVPTGVDDATFESAWRSLHADLVLRDGRLPKRLLDVAMSGWETVAAAHAILCCFPEDAATAIAAAVASGGDTDTVASIVGAMAGARAGARMLPAALIDGLADGELIRDATGALCASTQIR